MSGDDGALEAPILDAWAVLAVAPGADARTIKRAYRAAVRAHPPDRDRDAFERVQRAYETLKDPLGVVEQLVFDPTQRAPDLGPPEGPSPLDALEERLARTLAMVLDPGALGLDASDEPDDGEADG